MSWCYYIWKEALVLTQGLAFKYKFTSFFLLFHLWLSSNSYLVKKTGSSWRLQALKYANGSWECWRNTWNLCVQSICKYANMSLNAHGGQRRKWVLCSITFDLIPLQQSLTETEASPAASNPLWSSSLPHSSGVIDIFLHWTISPASRGECFQGYIITVLLLCSQHPSLSLTSLKHINNLTVFWQKRSHP